MTPASFPGDGFVEVEEHPGEGEPGLFFAGGGVALGEAGLCFQEFLEALFFHRGGRAGKTEAEGVIDAFTGGGGRLLQDAPSEGFGEFEELLAIQKREGLERGIRADAAGAGAEAIRSIKDGKSRVRGGAPEVGVTTMLSVRPT